jgi:hypothetical protein
MSLKNKADTLLRTAAQAGDVPGVVGSGHKSRGNNL